MVKEAVIKGNVAAAFLLLKQLKILSCFQRRYLTLLSVDEKVL